MTFSTRIYAAPQGREVNSATFYFNKSVVINNTIKHMSKLNTKIFQSNKIDDNYREAGNIPTFQYSNLPPKAYLRHNIPTHDPEEPYIF